MMKQHAKIFEMEQKSPNGMDSNMKMNTRIVNMRLVHATSLRAKI